MSKKTTNFGFIKPELTDAADITATNTNWDVIDTELKKLDGKSGTSIVHPDTLHAASWGGNIYTYINNNIVSSTQLIELLPSPDIDSDQLKALQKANIVGTAQTKGNVTVKAFGEVPTIDIPVVFIIRGDV